MRILGAILAGGRSSRFGSDKAVALMPDGRTLMAHAAAALRPHVQAVVICGRMDGLPDRPMPDMGPLGGLNAALHHASNNGFDGVLTTGCDMPVYPAQMPDTLVGDRAAILDGQPMIGWWPASLAPLLDQHLAEENNRSIRGWLDRAGGRSIHVPGLFLPNINRPEDLKNM
ncbi:molybdenum cofactor guanylyltransferase [Sphingobium sp. CCH11-B1]|jgi:molybdopterin-guanine dinucleotide biosynthesis protein A|uniref:molybdenum cofactor guanylyltransferase n=1 Tax=Sphingobium sp. CCH11-B1 TaxID=1768781 RepID=UPI000835D18C|nr:molybdenum cofactor guanylyltransferase [Sphingobium sp. CCH11-B1]MEA3391243.1 molybdenum cofactor guanylyltransferase [Pseudomonadota bacterium]